jgi:hypothetical protein
MGVFAGACFAVCVFLARDPDRARAVPGPVGPATDVSVYLRVEMSVYRRAYAIERIDSL